LQPAHKPVYKISKACETRINVSLRGLTDGRTDGRVDVICVGGRVQPADGDGDGARGCRGTAPADLDEPLTVAAEARQPGVEHRPLTVARPLLFIPCTTYTPHRTVTAHLPHPEYLPLFGYLPLHL